ncbi:MAG: hypothetical protein ACYSWO_30895, partial [Planctomycetota bacterium]
PGGFAGRRRGFKFGHNILLLPKGGTKLSFPNPSEAKHISNPFGESDSQTLGAGLELCALQVIGGWFGRRFAEQQ